MAYTGAASSLVRHGRLRVPTGEWDSPDSTTALSLWPPGYPVAIAVPTALGATPVQAARWVNIVAAAVTAATVFCIVATPLGTWAGVACVIVVFVTQAIFDVHFSVLSEPLFIALLFLLIAAMVFARDRLLLMGVIAAGAVMVRYAGAAGPAAVMTWVLLDSRYGLGTRFRRAIVAGIVPAVCIVAWFTRTALAPDRHATPQLSVYGNWTASLLQARDTLAEWLVPVLPDGAIQRVLAVLIALVAAAFVIATVRDTSGRRLRTGSSVASLLGATAILAGWYLAVVVASRTFVGGTIPFDWRILAPLIALLEIIVVASIAYWWRAYHLPLRAMLTAFALVWAGAAAIVTANDASFAATEGSDFAGVEWRHSPLVMWVREHGAGHMLFTNWPPALYFHANRYAREFPDSSDPEDVSGFARKLRATHGYVVGFDTPSPDVIAPAALARRLGLRQIVRVADGSVWEAPQ